MNQIFTRPNIDRYIMNNWFGFVTKGATELQLKDFIRAQSQLNQYHQVYMLMNYANDLYKLSVELQNRLNSNDYTNPINIFRSVS